MAYNSKFEFIEALHPSTKYFLLTSVLVGFTGILFLEKGCVVLWANGTYSEFSILLFRMVNMLGDGLLFAILGIPLLFIRFSYTIHFALLIIVQTIIVRFFKDGIAEGWHRPIKFFETQGIQLNIGKYVDISTVDSFPSGHATTAFTICFYLFFFVPNRFVPQFLLLVLFTMAALARVYLAQHFLIDIVAGLFCAIATHLIVSWISSGMNVHKVKGSLLKIGLNYSNEKNQSLL